MLSDIHRPGSPRVHAIILTQDRAAEFGRCVETALATLGLYDALTVLDDSSSERAPENLDVLAGAARRSRVAVSHVPTKRAHDAVARTAGGSRMAWQAKSAVRDIAPLRNLSLLLSAAVGAHTTVLVDDDVSGFDLVATHRFLTGLPREPNGVVVGVEIGGSTEMDTVTRLQEAMKRLTERRHDERASFADMFRAAVGNGARRADECRWVSAGYMAFSIRPARLIAFPPGYNEDWLWCLLQHSECGTRIVRTGQLVSHEPPKLRRPTCDDVRFELAGDLILDSLIECRETEPRNPASTLRHLGEHAPDVSVLPATRVVETMQQAAEVERLGRMHPCLWEYGLGVLEDMMHRDTLEVDGRAVVSAWCRDTETKQRAFAPIPGSAAVLAALRVLMDRGRL